ncbi:DUF6252 family protein [Flavobacterium enshiense]|uniref:DUF6252 family protein n=1 Tax=Flavobacterium enshiense TaxID=1341165 RepID=UPI00345DB7E6
MKKINLIALFAVMIAAVSFVSCSGDIEPLDPALSGDTTGGGNTGGGNTGGGSGTYYVKAKVDGVQKQWTGSTQIQAQFADDMFILLASNGSETMSLGIISDDAIAPNTYQLEFGGVTGVYTLGTESFSSSYDDFTTSPGNIQVVDLNSTNRTIKGKFTFIGKNNAMTVSKNVTEGEFFVQYQ